MRGRTHFEHVVVDSSEVTVGVCSTFPDNTCGWNESVRIRLCNEFGSEYFVYLLTAPPGCPLAYCVDAASRKQCIPPEVWLPDEFKCGGTSINMYNFVQIVHLIVNCAYLKSGSSQKSFFLDVTC